MSKTFLKSLSIFIEQSSLIKSVRSFSDIVSFQHNTFLLDLSMLQGGAEIGPNTLGSTELRKKSKA